MRRNKVFDTSLTDFYFEMINLSNITKIFAEQASNLLSPRFSNRLTASNIITSRECVVGEPLCGVIESTINSHSHTVDLETTLDHETVESELINEMEHENKVEETLNLEWSDEEEDEDKALCKEFLLD